MEKEYIIQICGYSNSGKTGIAQEIVDTLRTLNFNVEWDVTPDYHHENIARRTQEQQLEVLQAIKLKDTKIIVKEIQLTRSSKNLHE